MPSVLRSFQRFIRALQGLALLVLCLQAPALAETKFKSVPTQFISALADPSATSGTGADTWGLWRLDPGPRGVWAESYQSLKEAGGVAPAGWTFDAKDWWMEEHGLLMEQPSGPLPAGKYQVTGGREAQSVLTIFPKDAGGGARWELSDGVKLIDVTHLRCRSARYTPAAGASACTPEKVQKAFFPVAPGAEMPAVEGCAKQDYAVLFVVGVEE